MRVIVAVCILALATPAHAQPAPDRIDRIAGLARIWAEVRFFHPAIYERGVDWDGAFVRALPEIEAASDAASYRAAIAHLLAALGDRRTAVVTAPAPSTATDWKQRIGDVLVVDARAAAGDKLAAELATASVVVVDLRGVDEDDPIIGKLVAALPAPTAQPSYRSIRHVGWRTQGGGGWRPYWTAWEIAPASLALRGVAATKQHVVFVVDPVNVPTFDVAALWMSKRATIVAAGQLDEHAAAPRKRIELPFGVTARIRVADVVAPGGAAIAADLVVASGDPRVRAIEIAKAIASGAASPRAAPRRASESGDLQIVDDDASPPTAVPPRERRILGAVRMWATVAYFHGIPRTLTGWDKAFRAALPRIEVAADRDAYMRALQELIVTVADGHTSVTPIGGVRALTAIAWRRVEGKIVAFGLRDATAGVAIGDELVAVDGVPVEQIAAANYAHAGSSTDEARVQRAVTAIDVGARGSSATLDVRDASGATRRVSLPRASSLDGNFYGRDGAHFRKLDDRAGYVDLARLTSDEIDPMFAALEKLPAIIFDMRGYPQGRVGFQIASRLAPRPDLVIAEFRTPIVTATGDRDDSIRELQRLAPATRSAFRGKVVVLIDDRAISAAEHVCLMLEVAAGAKFVGSPTTGANGSDTYVKLPGGLELRFTGQEVRHADGRPLQQVGIQPDILVRPTLRGLRAGKDEVLDRARAYLATGK